MLDECHCLWTVVSPGELCWPNATVCGLLLVQESYVGRMPLFVDCC
jgi:hypothetical protein